MYASKPAVFRDRRSDRLAGLVQSGLPRAGLVVLPHTAVSQGLPAPDQQDAKANGDKRERIQFGNRRVYLSD